MPTTIYDYVSLVIIEKIDDMTGTTHSGGSSVRTRGRRGDVLTRQAC